MSRQNQPSSASQKATPLPKNRISRVWAMLTDPHKSYKDFDLRRRAKLLNVILIALVPVITLVGIVFMPILSGADSLLKGPTFIPASLALVASVFAYALNRSGKFIPAAMLYAIIFIVTPLMAISADLSQVNIAIGALAIGGVILTSVLLPNINYSIFASVAVVGGTALIQVFNRTVGFADIGALLSANLTNSLLIIFYTIHRNRSEKLRQDHLTGINQQLTDSYDSILEGWSRALEIKDPYTNGHAQRCADLTVKMAMAIGLKGQDLVHVYRGAIIHDIGKIGIPDHILLKEGPLTDKEMNVIRQHPQWGFEMLEPIPFLQPALPIAYSHHEKWDGSGYPQGLSGANIPLIARLFCIVDVYDALSSDRPYRSAWQPKDIDNYIQEQSGQHFDPDYVKVFFEVR